jgi:hypothetical protein
MHIWDCMTYLHWLPQRFVRKKRMWQSFSVHRSSLTTFVKHLTPLFVTTSSVYCTNVSQSLLQCLPQDGADEVMCLCLFDFSCYLPKSLPIWILCTQLVAFHYSCWQWSNLLRWSLHTSSVFSGTSALFCWTPTVILAYVTFKIISIGKLQNVSLAYITHQ